MRILYKWELMKIHTHRRRKLCVSAPPSRCSLMVIRNTILANNPTPVSWLSCWWCVVVPLLLTDQTLTSRTVNSHQSSLTIKSIYLTTQPGMIGGFGAWQKYHKEKHEKKKVQNCSYEGQHTDILTWSTPMRITKIVVKLEKMMQRWDLIENQERN